MADTRYRHLECRTEPGILVMTVTEANVQGEEIAEELRDEMLAALEAAGVSNVAVDFHHVQYISSTAFRPLLAVRRRLQETGGRIVLFGLTKGIGDVFYTTRMIAADGVMRPIFEMAPDEARAVARLNQPPEADAPGGSAGGAAG
jgi:anti-anti-sigma factor